MKTIEQEMTTEQLEQSKEECLAYAGIWKHCSDGSYEVALDSCGYYKVVGELDARKVNP